MDNLNLAYDDVLNRIPYRNLVIMQKDKLRACYGDKMKEVSDEEFFKGKIKFSE